MRMWLWMAMAAVAVLPRPVFGVEGDFQWNGRLKAGQTVEIKGINGSIHAEYASGSDVEVKARKLGGGRSDPSSVRVEAVPHAGGITICAIYPPESGRQNVCQPGEGGHIGAHDNDVKVEFTVRVPQGVRLTAKTVNGEVTADGLKSDVVAHTVNGKVRASTSGLVRANTVNGGLDVKMGAATWDSTLEFTTVNGSIDLTLPGDVNAEVHANTVTGGLSTDFPLTVSGKWGPKSLSGKIGSGGRQLKLSTVNGGIQLHRSGGRAI